jgi:integrase
MDRAEVNNVSIERIAGHSSKSITKKVYTHKNSKDLLQAIDKLDEYINKTLCI